MPHLNNLKIILQCNVIFIILTIIIIPYVLVFTKVIKYESAYTGNEISITGKIKEFSINGNKLKLTINAKEDIIATYYLESIDEKEELFNNIAIGKTIKLNGRLESPLKNTIPNNFNYKKYLYNEKIFYLFAVDNYEIVKENNFLDKIKDFLIKRAYNLENGDYLLVLVLGDKSLISSDIYNNYQTNGTSHLLAISGSHVAVLLTIFSFLLKKVKDIPKLIILSIILLFFGFLTNFQAAVCRAIFFFIINQINKIGKLNYSNLQVLFFTAFIMLIINPFVIYDLGFIYSFIICGGIIYYSDKITGNYFIKMLKLSTISFLFSLPISACINYEVNITSILINMLFVPWISVIVFPLAIITFIFPFLNCFLSITLTITDFLNNLFVKFSLFINIPKTSFILIVLLFIFIVLLKHNKKFLGGILVLLLVIKTLPKLDSNYYIYYLDIGQGDSTILISPYQKDVVMIDTGGKITYETEEWEKSNKTYNLSDNTIKFLKSLGITCLDNLIITHGDMDHTGEAINLVNSFKVEKVTFNCGLYNDLEKELIKVLDKKKIKYYSCIRELNIDNNKLHFLQTKEYDNENDNSNVIYTELNGYKFMFMGDASGITEKEILNKYNLPDIDVLKAGHHGSKTSSSKEFIDTINPKYSIISVGKNNRYGHPNKEALDNLEDSKIYRTDQDGSIMFKIKNNKLKIKTCSP